MQYKYVVLAASSLGRETPWRRLRVKIIKSEDINVILKSLKGIYLMPHALPTSKEAVILTTPLDFPYFFSTLVRGSVCANGHWNGHWSVDERCYGEISLLLEPLPPHQIQVISPLSERLALPFLCLILEFRRRSTTSGSSAGSMLERMESSVNVVASSTSACHWLIFFNRFLFFFAFSWTGCFRTACFKIREDL